MPPQFYQTPPARLAGVIYLLIAVFGGFSIGYVPSAIVAASPASTAANLAGNMSLFHAGIVADIFVLLLEVILTAILYVLFAPASKTLAMVAALARISMVLVMAINLLIYITPMFLLSGVSFLSGFEQDTLQAIAYAMFLLHDMGIYLWQLFFGLHLLALGYMIVKSTLFPHLLGWMMLVGSFGYSLQGFAKILGIEILALDWVIIGLLVVVTLGELAFAFRLLIKGLGSGQKQASPSAT